MEEVTTSTYELVRRVDGTYKINGAGKASVHLTTAPIISGQANSPRPTTPRAIAAASFGRLARSLSFDRETFKPRPADAAPTPRSPRAIDTRFLDSSDKSHGILSPLTPKFGCTSAKSVNSEGKVPEFQFFAAEQDPDVEVNFIDTPDLSSRSLGDPANHSAPPPSPSTPSSVSGGPHSTWDSHPPSAPSEPLEGATGSRARKDHGAFGDEATSTINQLNTPSPVLDRDHKTGAMTASKSCNCVMGMAMRKTPQTSTKMPREKLAEAMISPTEGSKVQAPSTSKAGVKASFDFKSPTSATTTQLPRSATWPKLYSGATPEDEEEEVIKRFTVTHKLGKAPSLLCRITIPDPPSVRSTDMASRWWWLLIFTAFLFSSTSGFLSSGPRVFTRAGLSSLTTSTSIPAAHDDGEAQFSHFTNFRANSDAGAGAVSATAAATSWHMGGMSAAAALVEALPLEVDKAEQDAAQTEASALDLAQLQGQKTDFDLTKVQAAISKSVAQSVIMSGAASSFMNTGNSVSGAASSFMDSGNAKARRNRVAAKWALREASRKSKQIMKVTEQLPESVSGWHCDDYGCVLRDETADGLTGELIVTALSASPLSEPQTLVVRSILSNILFNTTSGFIGGDIKLDHLGTMVTDWTKDPSNVARALLRHAFIPAVTHMMVHNVGSMAAHAAAVPMDIFPDSTEMASALAHCANSVVCMAELQATLLPNAVDALGNML